MHFLIGKNAYPERKPRTPSPPNLQGKGLDAGQVLPGGDWALVLPTHKLATTSLLSPENFVKISSSVQKLFMIFQNTDRQRQTLFFLPFTHSVSFRIMKSWCKRVKMSFWLFKIIVLDNIQVCSQLGRYSSYSIVTPIYQTLKGASCCSIPTR